mmetsp:Transcript_40541/g.85727  ORF Transcript_40541/g.85727 Transcript_40541/m.85727 type:complete len:248 (+) Transcript_40541:35-778(+)
MESRMDEIAAPPGAAELARCVSSRRCGASWAGERVPTAHAVVAGRWAACKGGRAPRLGLAGDRPACSTAATGGDSSATSPSPLAKPLSAAASTGESQLPPDCPRSGDEARVLPADAGLTRWNGGSRRLRKLDPAELSTDLDEDWHDVRALALLPVRIALANHELNTLLHFRVTARCVAAASRSTASPDGAVARRRSALSAHSGLRGRLRARLRNMASCRSRPSWVGHLFGGLREPSRVWERVPSFAG